MTLSGRVAIVTGSSRGIGKAIAVALAREGADIVVAARTETARENLPGTIHETANEIQNLGRRCLALKTDVSKEEDVDMMVRRTMSELKRVDILVNNAGISAPGSLVEISAKRWDLVLAVNLRGTSLCTKAILPYMIEQKRGSIINLSSVLGTRVISESIAYGCSKAAIERFTLGLAKELWQHNIAVNALVPSHTVTEGWMFLNPQVDTSSWQSVSMWGKYAALVAAEDAKTLTGQLLTEEELRTRFGNV